MFCLKCLFFNRNLAEILSERESISKVMQDALDEATDPWGVKAERVEMWVKMLYFTKMEILFAVKMFDCQYNYREQWLLKLRLLERLEQRLVNW